MFWIRISVDNSDPIFVAIWIASRGKAYSFLSSISLYTTVTSRFCADIVYLIVHLTLADTLTKLRLTFVSLLVAISPCDAGELSGKLPSRVHITQRLCKADTTHNTKAISQRKAIIHNQVTAFRSRWKNGLLSVRCLHFRCDGTVITPN